MVTMSLYRYLQKPKYKAAANCFKIKIEQEQFSKKAKKNVIKAMKTFIQKTRNYLQTNIRK